MTTCGSIYGFISNEEHCARPDIALEIMGFIMNELKFPYQLVRYNETVSCVRFCRELSLINVPNHLTCLNVNVGGLMFLRSCPRQKLSPRPIDPLLSSKECAFDESS